MNMNAFSANVAFDDSLFVTSIFNECLYSISLQNHQMNCITMDSSFTASDSDLTQKLYRQKEKIIKWCNGTTKGHIKIYDVINKTCKDVMVFDNTSIIVVPYNDIIVCISITSGEMKQVDINSGAVSNYNIDLSNFPEEKIKIGTNAVFYCAISDTCIFMMTDSFESIIELNLREKKILLYNINPQIGKIELFSYNKDYFYLWSETNILYLYDYRNDYYEEIWRYDGAENNKFLLSSILCTKDSVFLIPYRGNDIYIVDRVSHNCHIYNDYPKDFKFYEDGYKFFDYSEDSNNYYLSMPISNYFAIITKETGNIIWIKPISSLADNYNMICNKLLIENKIEDLIDYIYIIKESLI